jgi:hypothetical protein
LVDFNPGFPARRRIRWQIHDDIKLFHTNANRIVGVCIENASKHLAEVASFSSAESGDLQFIEGFKLSRRLPRAETFEHLKQTPITDPTQFIRDFLVHKVPQQSPIGKSKGRR